MYDELELDLVGDRKTALFFIISDTDATFNFLVSMAYTQLFNRKQEIIRTYSKSPIFAKLCLNES